MRPEHNNLSETAVIVLGPIQWLSSVNGDRTGAWWQLVMALALRNPPNNGYTWPEYLEPFPDDPLCEQPISRGTENHGALVPSSWNGKAEGIRRWRPDVNRLGRDGRRPAQDSLTLRYAQWGRRIPIDMHVPQSAQAHDTSHPGP